MNRRNYDMAERFEIVEKALLKLLEEKKYATLRDILTTMNPMDVAGLFDGLDEKQIPLMFRLLPKEQAAETFVEMEPEAKELLIRGFSDNELKEVLDELYVDDAADIVEEMPANVVQRILKHADPEMRSSINQILRYPEDSAGSIMTTEYVSLRPHMTVEEAILRIRRQGVDKETIYTCYVTAKDRTLHRSGDGKGSSAGRRTTRPRSKTSWKRTSSRSLPTTDQEEVAADPSPSITSSPCPWWTGRTGWWVSSPSTTPWTSCRTRPPRTWKSWPL